MGMGFLSWLKGKTWGYGTLPNGRTLWLINGGDPIGTYESWDDPPSRLRFLGISEY